MENTAQTKKILIMAGGTGGHVFPALAVADILRAEGWEVRWLGTADRMEADLVPKYGIPIDFIRISGLRGKGIKALLSAPFALYRAISQAKKIIQQFKPDVVLGMGGYVSGPGGIAAKLCGVPIVIHEQNGVAGLTNKWLAKVANRVLQAFPGALKNGQVVGNPIRYDVVNLPPPGVRLHERTGPIRVLVIGGSQGAQILNRVMPEVYQKLSHRIVVWHQTGRGAKEVVSAAYGNPELQENIITEFIDNIAEAYAWADVIVCRSGALTVSEIATAGLPAIFVPFQHKDKQQYLNAKPLEDIGAAAIVDQANFTPDNIGALLEGWDRPTLLEMAMKSKQLGIDDAAQQVAMIIKQTAK